MANDLTTQGPAPLATTGTIKPIIPADFDAVLEYARLVDASGMAPASIKSHTQIAVAIMHGYEVGLTPLAALQSIAVINGRPSLWGDGALALVQSSPACEDIQERFEGEGDALKAICVAKRKGRSPVTSEFSMADAKAAGLLEKTGPWKQYTKRMLKMRARAFALRDAFSDILRGLAIAEEQQDVVLKDITPAEAPPEPPKPPVAAKPKEPAKVVDGEIVDPEPNAKDAEKAAAKKQADDARETAAAQEAEEKAQAKAKRDAEEKERREAEAKRASEQASGADDHEDPFERYLAKFDAAFAAATTFDEMKQIWMDRDRSWPEDEQTKRMMEVRDVHKARVTEQGETKASAPPVKDFDEPSYRKDFLARLDAVKTAEEALALKEEVDAHVEAGRITGKRFSADYEDSLSAKFDTL